MRFIVYAQHIGNDKLVTYNQFRNATDWRDKMKADGFYNQTAINVLKGDNGKVMLLQDCATEYEAKTVAVLLNRAIFFME